MTLLHLRDPTLMAQLTSLLILDRNMDAIDSNMDPNRPRRCIFMRRRKIPQPAKATRTVVTPIVAADPERPPPPRLPEDVLARFYGPIIRRRRRSTPHVPKATSPTVKPMVALDPERPSLACLPEEVLTIITDILGASSQKDLRQLRLTCSLLLSLAQTSGQRHIAFNPSEELRIQQRCDWLRANALLPVVRTIDIIDARDYQQYSPVSPECRDASLAHIVRLLPLLTGLKSISFRDVLGRRGIHVPDDFIQALKPAYHIGLSSKVLAHTGMEAKGHRTTPPQNLTSLHGCMNLRALEVQILFDHGPRCQELTRPLKRLLLYCPNLHRLALDIDQYHTLPSLSWPDRYYCGLGFEHGEKLPPLEELTLTAYWFGRKPGSLHLDIFGIGYPLDCDERDYWAEHFDWSRLRKLHTFEKGFL
jgi:hypothetical protein